MAVDEQARLPLWIFFLRIPQGVLAFLVLVLTAYAASVFGSRAIPGYGLSWFTASQIQFLAIAFSCLYQEHVLWSCASLVLTFLAGRRLPASWKNRFALALILEVTTMFWWLVTFSLIADGASSLSALSTESVYYSVDDDYVPYFEYNGIDNWKSPLGATKAAAVVGAAEFALFLATVGISLRAMHSNRSGSRGWFETTAQEAQLV